MMRSLLMMGAIMLLVSSCTFQQNYTFNEDFSGEYKVEVDMSSMVSLMGEEMPSMLDSIDTDSIKNATNSIEGISNTFLKEEGGVISLGYEFDDMISLNKAQEEGNLAENVSSSVKVKKSEKPLFSLKGNKLIYNPPVLDESDFEDIEDMEGMGEMMHYEVVMNFAEPVKKINNKDWVISNDGKTIKLSITVEQLMSGDDTAVEIKF